MNILRSLFRNFLVLSFISLATTAAFAVCVGAVLLVGCAAEHLGLFAGACCAILLVAAVATFFQFFEG